MDIYLYYVKDTYYNYKGDLSVKGKSQKRKNLTRIIISTIFGLIFITFMSGCSSNPPTSQAAQTSDKNTDTPKPAEPVKPVEQAKPVDPNTDLQSSIKKIVTDVHGNDKGIEAVDMVDNAGANDGTKLITVKIKASDNLTNNLMRVGIQDESTKMLEKFTQEKKISSVLFLWTFDLQDSYGNSKEDTITKIVVNRDVMDKINYKDFLYSDLPTVANQYWEHPAMSK